MVNLIKVKKTDSEEINEGVWEWFTNARYKKNMHISIYPKKDFKVNLSL